MLSQIHNLDKNSLGLTTFELIIAFTIGVILLTSITLIVNPFENQREGRDNKRLADLAVLERAINEYAIDYGAYPDLTLTTRTSTSLPQDNSGPLADPQDGWIDQNLSTYVQKLPVDPLNDEAYFYTYYQNGTDYEINALLEELTNLMTDDGGDDVNFYEVGTDLTLL